MTTLTVAAASVKDSTFELLDDVISRLPKDDTTRDVLESVLSDLRAGRDIFIAPSDVGISPSQAAKLLGVSRAHLYKVLDSGALPFSVVGARDRRISVIDLREYIERTEQLRQTSAERAAKSRVSRARILDAM